MIRYLIYRASFCYAVLKLVLSAEGCSLQGLAKIAFGLFVSIVVPALVLLFFFFILCLFLENFLKDIHNVPPKAFFKIIISQRIGKYKSLILYYVLPK